MSSTTITVDSTSSVNIISDDISSTTITVDSTPSVNNISDDISSTSIIIDSTPSINNISNEAAKSATMSNLEKLIPPELQKLYDDEELEQLGRSCDRITETHINGRIIIIYKINKIRPLETCLRRTLNQWGSRGGSCWMPNIKEWAKKYCGTMRLIPIYENIYLELVTGLIIYTSDGNIFGVRILGYISTASAYKYGTYLYNNGLITEILCNAFGISYDKDTSEKFLGYFTLDINDKSSNLDYWGISVIHEELTNSIDHQDNSSSLFQSMDDKIICIRKYFEKTDLIPNLTKILHNFFEKANDEIITELDIINFIKE